VARTIQQFPTLPGISRYPWTEWLDGQVWELIPGEDFRAKVGTFKQMAQTQARKRGGRVQTRQRSVNGSSPTLVIQFRRD
jgi:hypothetical protein